MFSTDSDNLYHADPSDWPVCFGLLNAQAFHQPSVLLRCNASGLGSVPWPLKSAAFQPLVYQQKPVALPQKTFDPIFSRSAEEKQCFREWIKLKLPLDDCRQAINPTPKISLAYSQEDLSAKFAQHNFIARSSAAMVASSAPA